MRRSVKNVSKYVLDRGFLDCRIGLCVVKNQDFDRDFIFPKLDVVGSNPIARFCPKR